MTTFYLDYENGNDAADGSTFALGGLPAVGPWKTITTGATAARIAPGDIIRIAKSSAPTSLGTTGIWTNLSKTVTLGAAQTLNIDLCEVAWTANPLGDTTVALTGVATDAKEGSYCMKLTLDAAPQTSIMQAYYATGALNLSSYQKISFWIKNSAAIIANNWKVCLCSDALGAVVVDTFYITAIPSTTRWLPLTLTKDGGGNLGNAIASIAIYTDTVAPTASSNILVDDFIVCTTNGLNLQSLISKNSVEQGGTEGWYGIQSINGTTVLLDNDTNTKANAGRGYSGTTETVTTYKRETIKTTMASSSTYAVQDIKDNGSLAVGNIQFQGGYDTSTSLQTGETFFDGLNGYGHGIYFDSRSYTTLNYLNVCRYNYGITYDSGSTNNTITTINNTNNNTTSGVYYIYSSNNNIITTISNANNNNDYGIYSKNISSNNKIVTVSNVNNNNSNGICYLNSYNNTIITVNNANNNLNYGVDFYSSSDNIIKSISTSGNGIAGIGCGVINYIMNALIAETTEVGEPVVFSNFRIFSQNHDQTANNHWIFTDGGTINSQATTRHTASGIAWKLSPTSTNRASNYPLDLSIAKIAVTANNLVTVKAWFRRDNTEITGQLVCKGGQLAGIPSDVITSMTAAADTWEEITITFTPTELGVVEILAYAYGGTTYSVYIDDMTITQV